MSDAAPKAKRRRSVDGADSDSSAAADGDSQSKAGDRPRKRIVRACDPCRRKRAKCSGETPCAECAKKPHLCIYAPIVTTRQRRPKLVTQDQSPQIIAVQEGKLTLFESRLAIVERIVNNISPSTSTSSSNLTKPKTPLSSTSLLPFKTGGFLTNPDETHDSSLNMNVSAALSSSSNGEVNATQSTTIKDAVPEIASDVKTLAQIIPLRISLLRQLVKNYWEQFHPQLPLIDKSQFETQLYQLIHLQDSINMQEHWQFTLLLTSVVAIMLNFTPVISMPDIIQANPTIAASTHFKDYDVVLKHLEDSYKKIIFDHFETADLQVVQSLLLMVVTGGCQRGFRVTACWGYMGMAVRMAHELGIHRNAKEFGVHHPRFDKPSMDVRNRTWHCVVIMETYTCMWTGRPLTIHDNDWDAEYPDLLTPEMASLKHHGDLVHIVGCILKFGNRARQVDVDSTIAEISGKLESWLKRLDSDWKELVFQQRWNVKALMMLIYHGAVILFHRVAFGRVDTLECLASATAITKLISRFEKPPEINECIALFPTFTYCSMLACTVHMNQILSNATIADTRRFISSVQNLETCMKVFDALREIFMDVERCWKTMLDFLSIKGLSLEELDAQTSQSPKHLDMSPFISNKIKMGLKEVGMGVLLENITKKIQSVKPKVLMDTGGDHEPQHELYPGDNEAKRQRMTMILPETTAAATTTNQLEDFPDESDEEDWDYHGGHSRRSSGGTSQAGSGQGPSTVHHPVAAEAPPGSRKQRITRACNFCRSKRVKCTGLSPCKLCNAKGLQCIYSPVQPREKPRIPTNASATKPNGIPITTDLSPLSLSTTPLHRFETLEQRLGAIERLLSRMVPGSSDDPSLLSPLRSIREQLQHNENQIPAHGALHPDAGSSSALNPLPRVVSTSPPVPVTTQGYQDPTISSQTNPSSSFKTGGFLTNSDETLFSFWGSTSALGGSTNKAHIYKSIPRFVNGVLRFHIPSKEYLVQHKVSSFLKPKEESSSGNTAATGGSDNLSSRSSPDSIKERLNADNASPDESPIAAATAMAVENVPVDLEKVEVRRTKAVPEDLRTLHELIPLPEELVDHILNNYWTQFHPQFPLLEREWFESQLAILRSTETINVEDHWRYILVLISVIALMINFTPSLTRWKKKSDAGGSPSSALSSLSSPEPPAAATATANPPLNNQETFKEHDTVLQKLVDSFRKILFNHFGSPHIYVVQSLLIMVLTDGCQRGFRAFWYSS
ncbi:fungal-specific transcription factor domain-containing protein [Obelidium mucronatum]|nr:fungal-specific transcription factor domain-containing protein [Obelidium mucronatum]